MIAGVTKFETVRVDVTLGERKLSGEFSWRIPTLADTPRIGGIVSELAGGRQIADEEARQIAWMMATLLVATERRQDLAQAYRSPEWFPMDFTQHEDAGLLVAVYLEFTNWRSRFRRPTGTGGGAPPPATAG